MRTMNRKEESLTNSKGTYNSKEVEKREVKEAVEKEE